MTASYPALLKGPDHSSTTCCHGNHTWAMPPIGKARAEEGQVPKERQVIRCQSKAELGEARGKVDSQASQEAGLGLGVLTSLGPVQAGQGAGGCGHAACCSQATASACTEQSGPAASSAPRGAVAGRCSRPHLLGTDG